MASCSIAKADMWQTGWEAVRMASPAFIVPFMFVYEPALLTIGEPLTVFWRLAASCVGVICLAAGLQGYLRDETKIWERLALLVAAICLIKPGLVTDVVGLALLAIVFAAQTLRRRVDRNPAVVDAVAGDTSPVERQ